MNLLDGSLFNSSLIFRNLKNRNLAFSYVGYELQVDGLTQNTSCPAGKRMANDHYGLVLSLLLKEAEPGRAWSQSLVILQGDALELGTEDKVF